MVESTQAAPAFELPNHLEHLVRLADHEGRWVLLYWYPKADTPGCAAQAQAVRDQLDAFHDLGCDVYGASFDEPAENLAFHQKFTLNFDLLSDVDRSIGQAYGVAGEDGTKTHASRIAFLIDPSGTVVRRYEVDAPDLFADLVLGDLENLVDAG